jgi:hypothetical protein
MWPNPNPGKGLGTTYHLKDAGMLRKRIAVLMKLRMKVVKRTITSVTNACRRSGWRDQHRIQAWAYGGYITKMVIGTFDFYVSLHQHLLQMVDVNQAGWDYVHTELEHHTDELSIIRDTADYWLQALCMIYSYLQDGHNGGWYSMELQSKRNLVLLRGQQGGNDDFHCPKCGTFLHGGGHPVAPGKIVMTNKHRNTDKQLYESCPTKPREKPRRTMTKKKIPEESSLRVRMELSGRMATHLSNTKSQSLPFPLRSHCGTNRSI